MTGCWSFFTPNQYWNLLLRTLTVRQVRHVRALAWSGGAGQRPGARQRPRRAGLRQRRRQVCAGAPRRAPGSGGQLCACPRCAQRAVRARPPVACVAGALSPGLPLVRHQVKTWIRQYCNYATSWPRLDAKHGNRPTPDPEQEEKKKKSNSLSFLAQQARSSQTLQGERASMDS